MKKLFTLVLVFASSLALVSCAFVQGSGTQESVDGSTGQIAPSVPGEEFNKDTTSLDSADRNIIVTASAYLTAEDPKAAVDEVLSLVEKQKGLIDQKET